MKLIHSVENLFPTAPTPGLKRPKPPPNTSLRGKSQLTHYLMTAYITGYEQCIHMFLKCLFSLLTKTYRNLQTWHTRHSHSAIQAPIAVAATPSQAPRQSRAQPFLYKEVMIRRRGKPPAAGHQAQKTVI
jgi:hypothetical protein